MNSVWPEPSSETLHEARLGDRVAISQILDVYRPQLKAVVSTRLERSLAARMDASDVVQEVLATAFDSLADWINDGKPVYACLYRLTRDHLSRLRRDHIAIQKRAIHREANTFAELSDNSLVALCQRLGMRNETPSRIAMRRESQNVVRGALGQLREFDREVLVMRILEGTPAQEVARILDISEAAVNMRQLRALKRMRTLMDCDS